MKTQRGFSLIEMLVYIAVLTVVIELSFNVYYRYDQHTRDLRRNADDITRALRAGERWREDVRTAVAPPRRVDNGVVIPESSGEVAYLFVDGAVWRHAPGSRMIALKEVKASTMSLDTRQRVRAWRWELELASPQKTVLVRPLFSFTAVARGQS